MILGGGPNRIGQGIEFDYCCCHACFALKDAGYETIMVNCNPETVSTDYDTSDRLYFEPLTAEDVLEIIDIERSRGTLHGVIVQFGGQTPLKLAEALEKANVPILGTSPDMIDLAEDRDRFKKLLDKLGLQAAAERHRHFAEGSARDRRARSAIPIVIRPSYVLGGRAMEIVHDTHQLDRYLARLTGDLDRPSELVVSKKRPLLLDRYLSDAIEVDVDCLADGKDTFIAGIMEHIEEAGVHSGDSACALPPHSLDTAMIAELERQTRALALALKVGGLMNVQYAIKDRRHLRARSQSARLAHRAVRRQGDRAAGRQDRGARDGGREARSLRSEAAALRPCRRQGGGVPVRALPRRRHRARAGDEIDRRGDGHRHATSRSPSPRARSAAARGCRVPAPCSSRCATPTSRASWTASTC